MSVAVACGDGAERSSHETASVQTRLAAANDSTIRLTDDGGHPMQVARPARRIISLIPSATETLIALGLTDRIVGRTRYDVDPHLANVPLVGGGVDPSVETIVGLRPDLVLTWENDKRELVRNKLAALGVPVFTVRTEDTSDVFRTIHSLGQLTGRDSAAAALAASLRGQLDGVRRSVAGKSVPSVLFVVYNDPPMTAGPKTFIGQLLSLAGGRSIFSDTSALWPNIAMEEIVRRQPDIIIVPVGEFKNNSIARFHAMPGWRDLRAVQTNRVVAVPADLVSRPGSHMGDAAETIRNALHPELRPVGSIDVAKSRVTTP